MTILEELSEFLSMDTLELINYIATCPHRYKVYTIPKRSGSGVRTIAQPAKELKYLQKHVCNEYLATLPVHDACKAYKKNTSIKDNALAHVKNKYLLKMDFENFFPSITPPDLIQHIEQHLEWKNWEEDKFIIEKLFFYAPKRNLGLKLSIGSPTSPFLSNSIMYSFDSIIDKLCTEREISYTRYADDISFSTNIKDILFDFANEVSRILQENEYPQIRINHGKTTFLSRKGNMHITGLVLTNQRKVSIGRKKKRYIKSLIYRFLNNNLNIEEKNYLSGYLAFCISVEPEFISSLEKKYGQAVVNQLLGK